MIYYNKESKWTNNLIHFQDLDGNFEQVPINKCALLKIAMRLSGLKIMDQDAKDWDKASFLKSIKEGLLQGKAILLAAATSASFAQVHSLQSKIIVCHTDILGL